MTARRLPRWEELRPLLRFQRIPLDATERRLAGANTIPDLRRIASRRTPKAVFDYTDGAAEQEVSLRRMRDAFRRVEFRPGVLRDVSDTDPGTTVLDRRWSLPFGLGPTGFTRMMHHEGERAVVRAAQRAGVTYALSTMGTTSIEDVAAEAPAARKWFQLYVWRDRDAGKELVQRALDAGYEALVLTVDTPIAGARMRDVRNGLTIPPSLTPTTVLDAALHPAWWFNLLTTEPLTFASMTHWSGTVADLVNRMFDPSVTFDDLAWIRDAWPRSLVVKGIQNVADARAAVEHGADAIVVSNHGGRQLDRTPVPLALLPEIADAVDDHVDVLLDGGILSGADIVAGLALGAKACLVGRAYLYGLMAGGERGVDRAVEILAQEVTRTLRLLGVSSVEELDRSHVSLTG
ncbi:MAG TPA: alpha-hydroxy acid oxidase [Streptosporangiales bacterium]